MRIGLDIGGTKIDAVLLRDDLTIASRVRVRTGKGPRAVVASAERAVHDVVASTGGSAASAVASIGAGIPGMVDAERGRVRHAVNLDVTDLALADELSARVGVPVHVENDVKAASLGAYHLLSLTGSAALLNLGTGVAAGIVLDGRLWRGPGGGAGEVGHIPIEPGGAICGCGQRGCIETLASGSAVARLWPSHAEHPAVELFDAADAGDERARTVRRTVAQAVASGIRVLALTVDVETVVLAGGLSHLGDRLRRSVTEVLEDWGDESAFLASLSLPSRVRMLPPELAAAAVGAALVGIPDATAGRQVRAAPVGDDATRARVRAPVDAPR